MLTYFRKNKIANTLAELARVIDVKVTRTSLDDTLIKHPDFPSLLSVGDTLNRFGIANMAAQRRRFTLQEMPLPFITQYRHEDRFILVTAVTPQWVTFYNGNRYRRVATDVFQDKWTFLALLVEAGEGAGEKEYRKNRISELRKDIQPLTFAALFIVFAVLTCIIEAVKSGVSAVWFTLAIFLKIMGIAITSVLLWYDIDKNNTAIKKLCGATGGNKKQTNCSAVLDSRYASLMGISWSEIGFGYFSFGFLTLILFAHQSAQLLSLLTVLSFMALPFIMLSLWFQWRYIKQWCMLCIAVQATLLLEIILYFVRLDIKTFQLPAAASLPGILLAAALPFTGWRLLKKSLKKGMAKHAENRKLKKIKFNIDTFLAVLKQQRRQTCWPASLGVNLGNSEARNTLVKVCNPYCQPCCDSHETLVYLLGEHANLNVKIMYNVARFTADPSTNLVRHFLAINKESDSHETIRVLNQWYLSKDKDYDKFRSLAPSVNDQTAEYDTNIKEMTAWCEANSITDTPTFYFNGHRLPEEYDLRDLSYFLYE
ncbi:putative membrane protein [Filimonas zeae]|uniref:Vitamin K epoxide reductase family protein n=1 Tax=Filimonas zeae TaxID=1737353 RepID=A0A917IRE7_9BACT|nr:vitamin K epoxide reductase family protein [Filimonas zeae]MDR6338197.1 putative membrane protein [Filimonas zeae]GGH62193.1 hypothetical protein GCM10011379_11930 [Filimonas zeae]